MRMYLSNQAVQSLQVKFFSVHRYGKHKGEYKLLKMKIASQGDISQSDCLQLGYMILMIINDRMQVCFGLVEGVT